jgi:hypothetical protein
MPREGYKIILLDGPKHGLITTSDGTLGRYFVVPIREKIGGIKRAVYEWELVDKVELIAVGRFRRMETAMRPIGVPEGD